jgi:hypothetical protein
MGRDWLEHLRDVETTTKSKTASLSSRGIVVDRHHKQGYTLTITKKQEQATIMQHITQIANHLTPRKSETTFQTSLHSHNNNDNQTFTAQAAQLMLGIANNLI